jgi:hypothetical protein
MSSIVMATSVIARTHAIGVANVFTLRVHQWGTVRFGTESNTVTARLDSPKPETHHEHQKQTAAKTELRH